MPCWPRRSSTTGPTRSSRRRNGCARPASRSAKPAAPVVSVRTVDDLGERIRALPGADRLLPALDGLAPAWLVGGAVRDLLLGAPAGDLDVAIEGDAREAARALAERLDGEVREHERFGTATVRAAGLVVDLATTRRESYARPGALPEVEPAPLDDDL